MNAIPEHAGLAAGARIAVRALGLNANGPDQVIPLEHSPKSTVVRARWQRPRARDVVLKRCDPETARIEATVYRDVLPRIPIRAPRLLGVWVDDHATWLAIEDLGDEPPPLGEARHRARLSRWVGELHVSSRDLADAPSLPDRSVRHYLGRLQRARVRLADRGGEALSEDDARELRAALEICDVVAGKWEAVEEVASLLPPAFVHADLAAENLRLAWSGRRVEVTAIDWEKAGLGTPCADLAITDPCEYARAANAPLDVVEISARVARLLRTLSHDWASKPISKLGRWRRRLERDLAVVP
jgi:Phosphotransferase enzyme family